MSELLGQLNDVQRQAVTYGDGPMLVLAGAGSGKTRVLTHRIAWLIEQGVEGRSILAVTFTNKAAQEMRDRVAGLLKLSTFNFQLSTPGSAKPSLGTFHATCVRILRHHSHHLGIPNNFSIYDETDANALIKQAMERLSISTKQFNPSALKGAISSAKNEMVDADEYRKYARGYFTETVAKVYPVYQHLLSENQALDFDDLLLNAWRLLDTHDSVLAYYQDKWQYVLVDEYQDTNRVQYLLVKLLTDRSRNINVVGDAAQSIYAFRGADLRNVNQFAVDYPEAAIFNLEQNYRSTQKILTAATKIIEQNRTVHPVLELWTEKGGGEAVVVHEAGSGEGEVEFVVGEISGKWKVENGKLENGDNSETFNSQLSTLNFSDIAILYRTNAQSRAFEEGLIRAGIPYRIVGGVRFYERREIKDLVAYLRLIANPQDTVAHGRIVNVPPRGIGRVTQMQGGPKLDVFERMMGSFRRKVEKGKLKVESEGEGRGGEVESGKLKVENLEIGSGGMNVLELLDHVIETIKYKDYILDGTEEGQMRWENVQELRSVAERFSEGDISPIQSLQSFLESIALLEQTDEINVTKGPALLGGSEKPDTVTLMTLHAAKGLEFPVVFMVGMEEGLFPHSRALDDEFELQEERRLCYVGMTRAMDKLYLTCARDRLYFGRFMNNLPSRFLNDLPEEVVEFERVGDHHRFGEDSDDEVLF